MDGIRGLTSPLWPIRYKPLPDELLSSWLVRLAHGHGLKVQTFCNLIFGNRLQVWNRDIDRLAPKWLLDALVLHTGTPTHAADATTLKRYEGVLFSTSRASGPLPWVQSLMIYHRTRAGFGQQFCPACLAEGGTPYYRKTWRLAIKTMCVKHDCMLLDRCPNCAAPVSFFRMDMGRGAVEMGDDSLAACYRCSFNLATATRAAPPNCDVEGFAQHLRIVHALDRFSLGEPAQIDVDELAVLRHLVTLMISRNRKVRLRSHLADTFGTADPIPEITKRTSFESLPVTVRHVLVQWGLWLLCDPLLRLGNAVRHGDILYNHLLRDFDAAPLWYLDLVTTNIPRRRGPRPAVYRVGTDADLSHIPTGD